MPDWAPFAEALPVADGEAGERSQSGIAAGETHCPSCGQLVAADHLIPAGDSKICPACRELYLQRLKEGLSPSSDSAYEAIRQTHIKHEASLKSVGLLMLLGGALMLLGGVMVMVSLLQMDSGTDMSGIAIIIGIIYAVLGGVFLLLAHGYRKLKRWIRIPGTIVSCLGLLSFPIGTLINGYILYLLWSQKGKMVLSAEYQEVIAATPHIRHKTSVLVWIFLAIVALGLLAALLIPAFGSVRGG
jgi:hypothetical protein